MNKVFLFSTFFFLFIISLSYSQKDEWKIFHSNIPGEFLGREDNYVWVNSRSGLHRIDIHTDEIIHYNTDNSDLPINNWFYSFTLDSSKGVWIGTGNGLVYFSDEKFYKYYDLYNKSIRNLCTDIHGNIIAGYDKGISIYDGGNWIHYNKSNTPFEFNSIHSIAADRNGNIWIGARYIGLIRFDGDDWYVINDTNSILRGNSIYNLIVGRDNNLYFQEYHGWGDIIYRVNENNELEIMNDEYPLIYNFTMDAEGNLWVKGMIGNDGNLLMKYDYNKWEEIEYDLGKDTTIGEFGFDMYNNMWGGIDYIDDFGQLPGVDGFYRIELNEKHHYNLKNSELPGRIIMDIRVDNNNNKWIANNKGVTKINPAFEWKTYNTENSGLPIDWIYELAIDSLGNIWAGTRKGLAKMDIEGNWTVFNRGNSPLMADSVYGLAVAPDNTLWIGLKYGFLSYKDGSWKVYYDNVGGKYDFSKVWLGRIFTDLEGTLWLTHHAMDLYVVTRFDGESWEQFKQKDLQFERSSPTDIAFDKDNNIYIGGTGGEISKFDGEKWERIESFQYDIYSEFNHGIASIEVDDKGIIWFGTYWEQDYGSFYKKDGDILYRYDYRNSGLHNVDVSSLCIDKIGNKWLGSNYDVFPGMSVFNEYGPVLSAPEKMSIFDMDINLYPNPFADMINIEIFLPEPSETCIEIMNIEGETVKYFDEGILSKGSHVFNWDGTDNNGAKVPSGAYIVKVSTKYVQAAGKVMLVR